MPAQRSHILSSFVKEFHYSVVSGTRDTSKKIITGTLQPPLFALTSFIWLIYNQYDIKSNG